MNKITSSESGSLTDEDNLSLELKIIGFFEENLNIKEAGKYELKLKKDIKFSDFANVISCIKKIKKNNNFDILLNSFSIKKDNIVRRFLQQNTLILDKNMLLIENLTLYENLKIVSLMFSGYDLSDACLSSFLMKDIKNEKIKNLTIEQKKMVILSYTVCCPSIIWCIDNELLDGLSEEKMNIFKNTLDIRIKHGGIVLTIK